MGLLAKSIVVTLSLAGAFLLPSVAFARGGGHGGGGGGHSSGGGHGGGSHGGGASHGGGGIQGGHAPGGALHGTGGGWGGASPFHSNAPSGGHVPLYGRSPQGILHGNAGGGGGGGDRGGHSWSHSANWGGWGRGYWHNNHYWWPRQWHGAWGWSPYAPYYLNLPAFGGYGYYWYYCRSADAYAPDLRGCPEGWQTVPAEQEESGAPPPEQLVPPAAGPVQPESMGSMDLKDETPGQDIYHWVDADGVDNYSTVVPVEVRATATKVQAHLSGVVWTNAPGRVP